MKAVVLKAYGDIDQMHYEDVETPRPGAGEVLVKIAAAGVNPADWKFRSGAFGRAPLQQPAILGYDLAGEVAALGEGVTGFKVGQRVMALADRAYAEYSSVKAELLALIPESMSFEQAAALPLVTMTGAQLIERGVKAKDHQSVLLTGALGSVGRTAIFVAAQHRAHVAAVVRASQMPEGELLGTVALVAIEDEETLSQMTGMDAFADTVGGTLAVGLLKYLRPGGIFATVLEAPQEARDGGFTIEEIQVRPDPVRLSQLAQAVAANRYKIPVASVLKLAEAGEAHRRLQAGGVSGKIVLVP